MVEVKNFSSARKAASTGTVPGKLGLGPGHLVQVYHRFGHLLVEGFDPDPVLGVVPGDGAAEGGRVVVVVRVGGGGRVLHHITNKN